MLAEEIVIIRGGQRRVAVGGADHSELEWIGPELLLEFHAEL